MIKDVFIPEKIGTKYIFSKRVLGLEITRTNIKAALVQYKGSSIIVEQLIVEPVEFNNGFNNNKKFIQALKSVLAICKQYDEVRTVLSSSVVNFKELTFPFSDNKKIEQIIPFEIEPLLPFSIDNAVFDFIIMEQDNTKKESDVIVAAVQKQYIQEHLDLFEQAGIIPQIITIDMLCLYNVYLQIPEYTNISGGCFLLNLGIVDTHIAYIHNKKLLMIRSIAQGIAVIAKTTDDQSSITIQQAIERLYKLGLEGQDSNTYDDAIKSYWSKLSFTISSCIDQTEVTPELVLLCGEGATIPGMTEYMSDLLGITCKVFNTHLIARNNRLIFKGPDILPVPLLTLFGAVFNTPIFEDFNLRKGTFDISDKKTITLQLLFAILLIVSFITLLMANNFWQIRRMRSEVNASQQEALEELQRAMPSLEDETDLEDAIDAARKELAKEKDIWSKLSDQSRSAFLRYLAELSLRINKEKTGFNLEQITMNEDGIILKARVTNTNALKELQNELRQSIEQSKLFVDMTDPQTEDFTMRITVAKPVGDL